MPKAFVTGATGFLGQHLVGQLLDAGWQVRILRRESSDLGVLAAMDIEHAIGDITDAGSVRAAMDEPFDAVFHVAADISTWRGDYPRQTAINVEGTRNVLTAAVASRSGRFIHTSSVTVWGLQHGELNEKTPRDASVLKVNYARTKALAEALVQSGVSQGMDAVLLNPCHIMGPLDRHGWMRMIRQVARGRLPGIPTGSGSFSDVREVARAHIRAVKSGRTGENYLLGGDNRTFPDLVADIARHLGVPVKAPRVPGPVLRGMARAKDLVARVTGRRPDITPDEAAFITIRQTCDSSKAIKELDYRVTPFDQLLADCIEWARGEGML